MRTRFFDIDLKKNPFQLLLLTEWCADNKKNMSPARDGKGELTIGVPLTYNEMRDALGYIDANSCQDEEEEIEFVHEDDIEIIRGNIFDEDPDCNNGMYHSDADPGL